MVSSSVVAVALTVVFVVTGAYALVRWAALTAGRPALCGSGSAGLVEARAAELLHVLMSVAMIAMVWAWSGGPASGSGVVQLAVFGLFTVVFAIRLVGAGASLSRVVHVLTAAVMVWMVAAMPALMGGVPGGSGDAHAGHAGHTGGADAGGGMGGAAGMSVPAGGPPAWVTVVTWVLVVALAGAAVLSLAALRRRVAPDHRDALDAGATQAYVGRVDQAGSVGLGSGASTSLATLTPALDTSRGDDRYARLAAVCHALMCAGMAVMLAVMA